MTSRPSPSPPPTPSWKWWRLEDESVEIVDLPHLHISSCSNSSGSCEFGHRKAQWGLHGHYPITKRTMLDHTVTARDPGKGRTGLTSAQRLLRNLLRDHIELVQ